MMKYREVKTALKDILDTAAVGRYVVIGAQRQQKAAENSVGNNRLVQVFFRSENFDLSKGRLNGPVSGNVNISVELEVSEAASGDISVLDNPSSSEAQKMAAMMAIKEASSRADDSFDELAEIIYQIIMDARNIDLGLPTGDVANRWVSTISKDNPNPRGGLVLLSGLLEFNCTVSEDVPGDVGVDLEVMDFVLEMEDDTVQKTGSTIEY